MRERCRLDVYHPKNKKDFSTVVWFHGGGLKAGKRSVPKALQGKGIAVVAVNYRLHPKVKAPAYIEDAAAAVAWTIKNIKTYWASPLSLSLSFCFLVSISPYVACLSRRYRCAGLEYLEHRDQAVRGCLP